MSADECSSVANIAHAADTLVFTISAHCRIDAQSLKG